MIATVPDRQTNLGCCRCSDSRSLTLDVACGQTWVIIFWLASNGSLTSGGFGPSRRLVPFGLTTSALLARFSNCSGGNPTDAEATSECACLPAHA